MATAHRALIEAGLSACRQQLEELGFARHEPHLYTVPLAPRIFGWVALGKAIQRGDGSMEIWPAVGLLHQDAQRVLAACTHLPYHRYFPPTVYAGMRQLAPDGRDVRGLFLPDEPVEEPAAQVCQPIGDYAVPWMREHATLVAMYDLLRSGRFSGSGMSNFKLPVIAWMLDKPDLARHMLRNELKRIGESAGPNAVGALAVYQRFAVELEERMALGAWGVRDSPAAKRAAE